MTRRIVLTLCALVMGIVPGLTYSAVVNTADAHEGESPHAQEQWGGQNCIQVLKVDGPVNSAAWHLRSVTAELNSKVASRSSLPAFKLGRSGCTGDINVDQVSKPLSTFGCVGWRPDFGAGTQERVLLNSRCTGKREWSCMGWGFAAGAHDYLDKQRPHIRHGCMWDGGSGPDHLSTKEASTLRNAYTGGRYAVGMTPRSKSYHNAMKADPKRGTHWDRVAQRAPRLGYQHACPDDGGTGPACMWDARHMGDGRGDSYIHKDNGREVYYRHKVIHNLMDAGNCHFPRRSERHYWDTIHGYGRILINNNDRVCPGVGTTYAIQAGNPGPVGTT